MGGACELCARESVLAENELAYARFDRHSLSAGHVLVVPKRHIATVNDLAHGDEALVGTLVRRAAAIATERGYAERGYRTVFNCNAEAGQTVFHLHLHLLAGRALGWPPG